MLNPFPIQFLSLLAYFILRVMVGLFLLRLSFGHFHFRHELKHILRLSWWPFGTFTTYSFVVGEALLAIMFILGIYTQIAALLTAGMSLKMLVLRTWFSHHSIPQKSTYWLLLAVCLSLFITGAGAFAFDLPI